MDNSNFQKPVDIKIASYCMWCDLYQGSLSTLWEIYPACANPIKLQ